MSFVTNVSSMNALNQRRLIGLSEKTATERLSSGLRINKGADDPSGLAISAGMKARVRGINQAVANAQDGLKMLGCMDAGLADIQSMLMRMRDLSVRAANEATLTDADRDKLQAEARSLREQIDQTAKTAKYNTKDLLFVDGDYKSTNAVKLNTGFSSYMTLSGDGSTVVWTDNGDLYIANGDGTNKRQLTSGPAFDLIINNAISHDGTHIVFQSDADLYSINSDGTNLTLLDNTSPLMGFGDMSISGDGKKVVYRNPTNNDLYIIDFDGKNKVRLTNSPAVTENQVSIDEKGTKVTFTITGGWSYVIDSDGTDQTLVSTPNSSNSKLTEDGNEIIYAKIGAGLIRCDSDGTNSKVISLGPFTSIYDLTGEYMSYRLANYLYTFDIDTMMNKQITYAITNLTYAQTSGDGNRAAYKTSTFNSYIKLADVTNDEALQIGPDDGLQYRMPIDFEDMGSGSLGVWGVTLTRTDGAQTAITKIDSAIEKVSDKRAYIGEEQKRLDHVINDLQAQGINTDAGRSRIEDSDMALETIDLVKEQLKEASNLDAITRSHEIDRSVLNLIDAQEQASAT